MVSDPLGRLFGQMIEALVTRYLWNGARRDMVGPGILSQLSRFMENPPAACAIRSIFLAVTALFHDYLQSKRPRFFKFVLLFVSVLVVSLMSTANVVAHVTATNIVYPIFMATGYIMLVNLCMSPEFSSRYGQMTLNAMNDIFKAL